MGKAKDSGDPRSEWPTAEDLCRAMGISHRKLRKLIASGAIPNPERVAGNDWRFNPATTEKAMWEAGAEPEEEFASKHDLLQAAGNALKNSQDHVESLLKLITGPVLEFQKQVMSQRESDLQRQAKLEDKLMGMLELQEAMLSQQHERMLAVEAAKAKEQRLNDAWALAKDQIPRVLENMGSPKAKAALKLFETLGPEKLLELKPVLLWEGSPDDEPMLNAEQRVWAKELFAQLEKEQKAVAEKESNATETVSVVAKSAAE